MTHRTYKGRGHRLRIPFCSIAMTTGSPLGYTREARLGGAHIQTLRGGLCPVDSPSQCRCSCWFFCSSRSLEPARECAEDNPAALHMAMVEYVLQPITSFRKDIVLSAGRFSADSWRTLTAFA